MFKLYIIIYYKSYIIYVNVYFVYFDKILIKKRNKFVSDLNTRKIEI